MTPNEEIIMHMAYTPDESLYRAAILWACAASQRSRRADVDRAARAFVNSISDLAGVPKIKEVP